MRYVDNRPCKECEDCLERTERERCNGCEALTLQIFIRWTVIGWIFGILLFAIALRSNADTLSVTSNVSTVKAWYREQLTFDEETGLFSRTNFPSLASATASYTVATNLPVMLAEATTSMTNNLSPLRAQLDQQRSRPITTMFVVAGPNSALDRKNLTFVSLSNEVERVSDGLDVHQWIYTSSILRSAPIMDCDISTADGTLYGGEYSWEHYGTNGVTITKHGEDFECYKMSCHIKTSATNLSVYVNPWPQIARKGKLFDFGNRRLRINNVYACTTNDLSWCGRFTTTNGTEITDFTPYVDKGRFFWARKEQE